MEYMNLPINLEGNFKLKEPLTSLINEKVVYTVDASKSITSLLDEEIDVEKFVYLDQGLTTDDYKYDLLNKIPIITLKSEGNALFHIPARYIDTAPQIVGVTYRNKAVIINLGYMPTDMDINFVLAELNDIITNQIGIIPESSIEDISGDYIASYTEDESYRAELDNNKTSNDTCSLKLSQALQDIETMKQKIAVLVDKRNL